MTPANTISQQGIHTRGYSNLGLAGSPQPWSGVLRSPNRTITDASEDLSYQEYPVKILETSKIVTWNKKIKMCKEQSSVIVFLMELTIDRRPPSTSGPSKSTASSLFIPCCSPTCGPLRQPPVHATDDRLSVTFFLAVVKPLGQAPRYQSGT
jgi:hypothetical protein